MHRYIIALLCLGYTTTAVIQLSTFNTLIPYISRELGFSIDLAGILISLGAFASLFMPPIISYTMDRYSISKIILATLAIFTISNLAIALSQNIFCNSYRKTFNWYVNAIYIAYMLKDSYRIYPET